MFPISKKIVILLKSLLSGNSTLHEVNELFNIAYQFALTRLRQLINTGKVNPSFFSISINSAAIDCIAELFRQDKEGNFTEFKFYFSNENDIDSMNEETVLKYFRRLVFYNLDDGLARLYKETDPIYGNILRALKTHIREDGSIKKFEMFKETYIYSCPDEELNKTLPQYPIDEIEADLISSRDGEQNTKEFLHLLLQKLNGQNMYRRYYSINEIAFIIKRLRLRYIKLDSILVDDINAELLKDDIVKILFLAVKTIKKSLFQKYVATGKMTDIEFNKYFAAIKDIINHTFIENFNEPLSYYEYLNNYMPELTKEEYRQNHHNDFEYMVRIALKDVREQLKELLY